MCSSKACKNEEWIAFYNFLYLAYTLILRFGILELRNRVTENDVPLGVTNSKMFREVLFSSY